MSTLNISLDTPLNLQTRWPTVSRAGGILWRPPSRTQTYITFSRNKPPQQPVKSITFPRAWYSGSERGMLYSYTSVLSRSQLVTLHVSAMLE